MLLWTLFLLLYKRRKYGSIFSSLNKVRNNCCDRAQYLFRNMDAPVISRFGSWKVGLIFFFNCSFHLSVQSVLQDLCFPIFRYSTVYIFLPLLCFCLCSSLMCVLCTVHSVFCDNPSIVHGIVLT